MRRDRRWADRGPVSRDTRWAPLWGSSHRAQAHTGSSHTATQAGSWAGRGATRCSSTQCLTDECIAVDRPRLGSKTVSTKIHEKFNDHFINKMADA